MIMDNFLIFAYDLDIYPSFQCSSPFFFVWFLPKVKLKLLIAVFLKSMRGSRIFSSKAKGLKANFVWRRIGDYYCCCYVYFNNSFFFKNEFFTGSGLRAHLIPSRIAHAECVKNIKSCLCNQTVIFTRMIVKLPRSHAQRYIRFVNVPLIFS